MLPGSMEKVEGMVLSPLLVGLKPGVTPLLCGSQGGVGVLRGSVLHP